MGSRHFAELHAHSYFTFLEGVDAPEDYVSSAQNLDLSALALLEVDGMYSLIRALQAAKESSFPLLIGSELTQMRGSFPDIAHQKKSLRAGGYPMGGKIAEFVFLSLRPRRRGIGIFVIL